MELNSRNVTLGRNKILVDFPYDKFLVSVVSTFLGRKFDKDKKVWSIPLVQIENVVNILDQYNFTFSTQILELYKEKRLYKKKVERIKKGEFKPLEIDMFGKLGIPLYDYQKIGSAFICAGKSILLADQPGLGKTIQTLSAVKIRDAKKVLIFAPISAKKTWEEEIYKWIGKDEKVVVIKGTPKDRLEQWRSENRFYIVNYHLLLKDLKLMQLIDWDFVVADEATDISNRTAKMTKQIKKLDAEYKVALTGTPISNTVKDIWSIMDWVQPNLLGTYWEFHREYCIVDHFGTVTSYKNLDKLREKIQPFFLRRLKKDVLKELPPKVYENIYSEFSIEETRMYRAIQEEILEELRTLGMSSQHISNAFVKMIRLKQMACSAELINGTKVSSKLDDLKDLLKIIMSGNEKALIFTQFSTMAYILNRELQQYKPLMIIGDIDEDERNTNRVAFQEDNTHRLLIMTSAGNRSLNLQRASYVIHYDLPWSIAALEQREDRAHRNGQEGVVTVYRMMVKDSIDEANFGVLFNKKEVSETVTGDSIPEAKMPLKKDEILGLLRK